MKKALGLLLLLLAPYVVYSQSSGTFVVRGDLNKYYPVLLYDGNYESNKPTEVYLGRSIVHIDQEWRGSLMAKLTYHTTNWGNGAEFIDVDLRQLRYDKVPFNFIAGWQDATYNNDEKSIIVWLKGGGTTYAYSGNAAINPKVYDGVANGLPYKQPNGANHGPKSELEPYVNAYGENYQGTAFFNAAGRNYIGGTLGIGTYTPNERLEVNGTIRAKEIKVEATNWPDYVFNYGYNLMPADSLRSYIERYKHLPDMQPAEDMEKGGQKLGDMNRLLLKKIEELTLYMLEQDKRINELQQKVK